MNLSIIQQKITAGNQFNAADPGTTPVLDKDIKRYPEAAVGGLFDFEVKDPSEIVAVEFHLADQTTWSITKRDSDGDDIVLWAGTTETSFVVLAADRTFITEGETLRVVTAGASGAMKLRIAVRRL